MRSSASNVAHEERLKPGVVVAQKYRLESLLARGGMGSVWVATNLVLEKQIAIKVLHASQRNELAAARLLREARAAAQIGHANIVQVYDFGHVNTQEPFIAMELLRGEDLAQRLDRVHRIPAIDATKLLLPVTSALAAAHAKGIVHRDMKPGNIFIAQDDFGNEIPKVVDFGIAKIKTPQFAPKLTMEGRVVGSPEYLSPEQARGEDDLNAQTDVWALCVTLYECVTGKLPFHDNNYNRLLRLIIEEEPQPITDHAAGDDALWKIIERGLSKNSKDRWPGMEPLGRALLEWLEEHKVPNIPKVRFSSSSHRKRSSTVQRLKRGTIASDDEPTVFRVTPPVPGPPPPGVAHLKLFQDLGNLSRDSAVHADSDLSEPDDMRISRPRLVSAPESLPPSSECLLSDSQPSDSAPPLSAKRAAAVIVDRAIHKVSRALQKQSNFWKLVAAFVLISVGTIVLVVRSLPKPPPMTLSEVVNPAVRSLLTLGAGKTLDQSGKVVTIVSSSNAPESTEKPSTEKETNENADHKKDQPEQSASSPSSPHRKPGPRRIDKLPLPKKPNF